jgi:hypothetical protein
MSDYAEGNRTHIIEPRSGKTAEKAKIGYVGFAYHAHAGSILAILKRYRGFMVPRHRESFEEMSKAQLWNQ